MLRTNTRIIGSLYCSIRLELKETPKGPELSLTGETGRIVTRKEAKRKARQIWVSYFEENPSEIIDMNARCGKRFTSARGAADYVLATDGEYHGLDARWEGDTGFLVESRGTVNEAVTQFFPGVKPARIPFKW